MDQLIILMDASSKEASFFYVLYENGRMQTARKIKKPNPLRLMKLFFPDHY